MSAPRLKGGRVMEIEDAFNAASNVFSMFGVFFDAVAKEIGRQKANSFLSESLGNFGASAGKASKEQMGIKELDVKTTSSFIKAMYEGLGVSVVIQESPRKLVFRNGKCPVYTGLKNVGYRDEDIEDFCRKGPGAMMDALFKQLDPTVTYTFTKYRRSPDDVCEEEVVFKK